MSNNQINYHEIDDNINAQEIVNDKFYLFKKLIMDVINEVAPLKSIRVKRDNLPWIDNEQRQLFDNRDKLHAVLMSYNDKSLPLGIIIEN